jgi:hypothetical protein
LLTKEEQLDKVLDKYKKYFQVEIVLNDWNDGKEFLYKANRIFMNEFFREGTTFYFPVYELAVLLSETVETEVRQLTLQR